MWEVIEKEVLSLCREEGDSKLVLSLLEDLKDSFEAEGVKACTKSGDRILAVLQLRADRAFEGLREQI